jgi:hypothetical protein
MPELSRQVRQILQPISEQNWKVIRKDSEMSETLCLKIKLKPGSLERVKEWSLEINRRKDEAMETLEAEGIIVESFFLDSTEHGDYFIQYIKIENFERGKAIADSSSFLIEIYHRAFKQAVFENTQQLELLLDLEHFPQ